MTRRDIEFDAEGVTLRGWFYPAQGAPAGPFQGKEPAMVPVVDEDPLAACALPTPDSWSWFSETGMNRAPARDWFVQHLAP